MLSKGVHERPDGSFPLMCFFFQNAMIANIFTNNLRVYEVMEYKSKLDCERGDWGDGGDGKLYPKLCYIIKAVAASNSFF